LIDRNNIRPGILVLLPQSDEVCYLDDPTCRERAAKYLRIDGGSGSGSGGEEGPKLIGGRPQGDHVDRE